MPTPQPAKETTKPRVTRREGSDDLGPDGKVASVRRRVATPPETGFKDLLLHGAPEIEDMMIPPRESTTIPTRGIKLHD